MKSTLLFEENGLRSFLLVLDKGEEASTEITAFAVREHITAASLSAIGAVSGATLGYFDPETSRYISTEFTEQMELASCLGDIADDAGTPPCTPTPSLGGVIRPQWQDTCKSSMSFPPWRLCSRRHPPICANGSRPPRDWPD